VGFLLYIDEDSQSAALLGALRKHKLDVISANEARMRSRSDEEQLEYATKFARAILTSNVRDYTRLHARWLCDQRTHGGIIIVEQHAMPVADQAKRLANMMKARNAEEMRNQIEYLSNTQWG